MRIFLDALRLGAALRASFRERDLDQTAVARRLGITQGAVSNFYRGKFRTLSAGVQKICEYAKIDAVEFEIRPKSRVVAIPVALDAAFRRVCARGTGHQRAAARVLAALEEMR